MQKLRSIFENLSFWGLFIIVIFIPLYLKFPLVGVNGTFVSIRLDDILIATLFAIWAVYILLSGGLSKILKDRITLLLLLFFFIGAVSLFSAEYLTKTISLSLGLLHFLRRVELFVFLPLVLSVIKTKKQVYSLLILSLLVLVVVNVYALGQVYLHFPVVSTTTSELSKGIVYYLQTGDRVSSTFSGFYDLAIYMLMAITISVPVIYFLAMSRMSGKLLSKRKVFLTSFLVVLAISSFVILVATATRLAFAAAIGGILITFVLIGKKKFILIVIAITTLALIFPSNLRNRFVSTFTVNILNSFNSFTSTAQDQNQRSQLNIPTLPNSQYSGSPLSKEGLPEAPDITPGEPTDSTDLGVYRSFDIRTKVEWPRAIRAFEKNPFLGTGYSSITLATDNDYLRSLGEVGLLGTLCFVLLLIQIGKELWSILRKSKNFTKYYAIGIFSMFIAFIVNCLFIDGFEASKVSTLLWVFIGLAIALGRIESNAKNN